MSKNIASILVCGVLGSVFSFNAQALPFSPAPNQEAGSMVTLVAGGCGIGFHRGPYGSRIRNGVYAPVVVVPHGCPYGYHYGAYGRCYPY